MKRTFRILLSAVLVLALCSCGSNKTNVKQNTKTEPIVLNPNVVEWKIEGHTITFKGKARMIDYNTYEVENESIPWFAKKDKFNSVVVSDGVTYLGNFDFYKFENIESVDIAGSVDSIGSSAFSGCTKLKTVKLGEGLREIGMGVFGQCTSLTEINIPKSVTKIGKGAFYGCSALKDLTIPESVQVFGDGDVFTGCSSLTIHCKEGSEAQTQAEKYGIPYDFNIK